MPHHWEPLTVRFEGGSKAGQIEALEEFMPRLRYPYYDGSGLGYLREAETATLPSIRYTYEEYEYSRRDYDGTYVYRWVNPEPALRRRIEALEAAKTALAEELRELKFGPEYNDAAFEDGLGGW